MSGSTSEPVPVTARSNKATVSVRAPRPGFGITAIMAGDSYMEMAGDTGTTTNVPVNIVGVWTGFSMYNAPAGVAGTGWLAGSGIPDYTDPGGFTADGVWLDRFAVLSGRAKSTVHMVRNGNSGSTAAAWAASIGVPGGRMEPVLAAVASPPRGKPVVFLSLGPNDIVTRIRSGALLNPEEPLFNSTWIPQIQTDVAAVVDACLAAHPECEVVLCGLPLFSIEDGPNAGNLRHYPSKGEGEGFRRAMFATSGFGAYAQFDRDARIRAGVWAGPQATATFGIRGSYGPGFFLNWAAYPNVGAWSGYWSDYLYTGGVFSRFSADLGGGYSLDAADPLFWTAALANVNDATLNGLLTRLNTVHAAIAASRPRVTFLSAQRVLQPPGTSDPMTPGPPTDFFDNVHPAYPAMVRWVDHQISAWLARTNLVNPDSTPDYLQVRSGEVAATVPFGAQKATVAARQRTATGDAQQEVVTSDRNASEALDDSGARSTAVDDGQSKTDVDAGVRTVRTRTNQTV